MRPAATLPSRVGYLGFAMIDEVAHASSVHGKLPLHPRVGNRATSQPLGQVSEDGEPIRKR